MTEPFNVQTYQGDALGEYITDAAAEIGATSGGTVGESLEKLNAFAHTYDLARGLAATDRATDIPDEYKADVAVMQIAQAFSGAAIGADIPLTFAQAWHDIDTVPDDLGGGETKDEFYADLERNTQIFLFPTAAEVCSHHRLLARPEQAPISQALTPPMFSRLSLHP